MNKFISLFTGKGELLIVNESAIKYILRYDRPDRDTLIETKDGSLLEYRPDESQIRTLEEWLNDNKEGDVFERSDNNGE